MLRLACVFGGLVLFGGRVRADPPNILVILTDDQGWSSLGCYGGSIVKTPHLDQLASQGARFTSAYVTSQCTPTRATLLSGQYTARHGMWHVIGWYGCPWAPMEEVPFVEQFPPDTPTIASELKRAGYTTGLVGKWHLTNNSDGDYQSLRSARGHRYGFDYVAPRLSKTEFAQGGDRGVRTLTDQTLGFIDRNRTRPWFCLLSHHMIHGKVVAPERLEAKYRSMGYGDTGPNRAVYLAGLETIDRSVGRLMDQLDQWGEAEQTVVVFLSDNGGVYQRREHRSLEKPHPALPRLRPNLVEYDNAPLRDGKGSIYEGGVRVPMIVRWPGIVPPETVVSEPVHAIDLAPTLFGIAGHRPSQGHVWDGVDLGAMLKTGQSDELQHRPVFQYCPFYDLNWALTPCASVRLGNFKLIEFFGDRFDSDHQYVAGRSIELYDLADDVGETTDLALRKPEVAGALHGRLRQWMDEMKVRVPRRNPHHDPRRAFETTNQKPDWLVSVSATDTAAVETSEATQ